MLRSCYRTNMVFTTDPAEVPTPVRWYFVDDIPNYRWLPYHTQFGSANWANLKMLGDYDPPGEVSPYMGDRPWYNGARPIPPGAGSLPCGSESAWENGVSYPWTPIPRNAAGTPLCCLAKPTPRLSALASLSSIVFQNPPCWPCPHPKPNKLLVTPAGWMPAWTTPILTVNTPWVLTLTGGGPTPCYWTKLIASGVTENVTPPAHPVVDVWLTAETQAPVTRKWLIKLGFSHPGGGPTGIFAWWTFSGVMSADCCNLQVIPFTTSTSLPPMTSASVRCASGPDYSVIGSLSKKAGISSPAFYHPGGPVLGSLSKTVGISSVAAYAPTYALISALNKTVGISSVVTYP